METLFRKIENFFYRYSWVIIVVSIALIPVINIVYNSRGEIEYIPYEYEYEEEYEYISSVPDKSEEHWVAPIIESVEREKHVFDIAVEDFENIHTDTINYLKNNKYTFSSSTFYNHNRIDIEIIPNGHVDHSRIHKFKEVIEYIFKEYGYDVEVTILVLNPNNTEIVTYWT